MSHIALQQAKPEVAEEELEQVLTLYHHLIDHDGMTLPDMYCYPEGQCYSDVEMLARLLEIKGTAEDVAKARDTRCEVAECRAVVESLWRACLEESRRKAWEAKEKGDGEEGGLVDGGGKKKVEKGNSRKKKKKRPYRKQEGGFTGTLEVEWGPEESSSSLTVPPRIQPSPVVSGLIEVMQGMELGKVATDCTVCLGALEEGEKEEEAQGERNREVVQLQCCHRYHASCLACWKETCREHDLPYSCPRCRKGLIIRSEGVGGGVAAVSMNEESTT